MSKKTKRQKTKKTKLYQSAKTKIAKAKKDSKKGLPSLKETEAYIKEHNLKVIDPLSDFGFKRLLASERNKDILIHLLNAFISHDTGVITDITYLPTELLGIHKEDKYVRFDLFCENQDGDRFIVEMQNGRQLHYADRLRVYTSLATVQNLKHGDNEYRHVPRVYSFNMMSVNLLEFDGRDRFFWSVYPKDDDNEIFSKNNVYYFVELSKFAAQLETLNMGDERNRLLYMFTHVVYIPEQEFESLTPMQQRFYEECQITNFTDMEKQGYVKNLMEHEDVREMVECEREDARQEGFNEGYSSGYDSGVSHGFDQGFDQGVERGIEKGRIEGREEGIKEGQEKGREKGREEEKHFLVLKMLAEGIDPVLVAKVTGLAVEEVRAMA